MNNLSVQEDADNLNITISFMEYPLRLHSYQLQRALRARDFGRTLLGGLTNPSALFASMNRYDAQPFRRDLVLNATRGILGILSDFEELEREAHGRGYEPTEIRLADIVAVEESNFAAIRPDLAQLPQDRSALANCFQISAFTNTGHRHALLYDGCGQDYARIFRTRLATMINNTKTVHGRYHRLMAANAWDDAAHHEASQILFGQSAVPLSSPHSAPPANAQHHANNPQQHHQPNYANIVPLSERL